MSNPEDWRNLKADWQSGALDAAFTAHVRWSLTWRIWLSRAWFVSEALSFLLLMAIIVQKIYLAQFAAAASLTFFGAFCVVGALWARSAGRLGNLDSLPGMVELALSRARTALRLVYGAYVALLILLVHVLVNEQEPPDHDRQLAQLAWLGISAAVAGVVHLLTRARIRRFTSIRTLFGRNR
jgi:hypothetical protein